MRLAIIPARGGSKRIPRKNIRDFAGKPMIAWSIAAAQASGCFDTIVASTDDPEIASIAQQYGAEVPFLRDSRLADDHTGTGPVIRDMILRLQEKGRHFSHVCCIYATAPFLTPAALQQGYQALSSSDAAYAFSVTDYAFPIQRAIRMVAGGRVEMLQPENFTKRSQDLEHCYHDAGQFYWGTTQAWLVQEPIFSPAAIAISLPRYLVQDIDTPQDWERAEWMFKAMQLAQQSALPYPQHE